MKIKKYLKFVNEGMFSNIEEWNKLSPDQQLSILKERDIISKTPEEEKSKKESNDSRFSYINGVKESIKTGNVDKFMEIVKTPEEAANYEKRLPFRYACCFGDIEFIKSLVSKGFVFNNTDACYAADYGKKDVIEYLFDKGMITDVDKIKKWTEHNKRLGNHKEDFMNFLNSLEK